MKWKIQDPDRFDRYVRGELPEREKESFEDQLRADPLAHERFEDQSELVDGIRNFERERLEEWMKQELRKEKSKGPRRLSLSRRTLMIAASILVLVMTLIPIYSSLTYWNRLESRYAGATGTDNLMGVSPELSLGPLEKARQFEAEGQMDQALEVLEGVTIVSEGEYDDYFEARFEMARIYVLMKDKDRAIAIAEDLVKRPEKHYLQEKASQLISDLKRPTFFFF